MNRVSKRFKNLILVSKQGFTEVDSRFTVSKQSLKKLMLISSFETRNTKDGIAK